MKVDGNEVGTYDGFVYIISEYKYKKIIIVADGTEDDRFLSLNDCLKEIDYDGFGVVLVILEDALRGKIYQYGNYGAEWYEHGETRGYA